MELLELNVRLNVKNIVMEELVILLVIVSNALLDLLVIIVG